MEPPVLVDGGGGGLGHLVVALHDVVALGAELPVHVVGQVLAGLRVHNLALHPEHGPAHGVHPGLQGVGGLGHGAAGRGLRLAVGDADLAHVHLLHHVLHHLHWAGGTGHDAGAHVGEVRLREVLVLQHGDEHGGHPVEGGDLLPIDAVQTLAGGEGGDGAHGGAVGHGGGHGQHHAEAVEHGHLDHQLVRGGQVHAVADGLAVVHHVVVGEHDPLGEAGGAGGVLHVGHVVLVDLAAALLHLGGGHRVPQAHGVVPGVAAGLLAVHGDDVAQHR